MSQQINLFNPIFLQQKKLFSFFTMLQALGLILLGSVIFYGYARYQVQSLAIQSGEMSARYTAEQQRLARVASEFSPQRASQQLNEEVKSLEAQLAAQNEMLETLKSGAIGNTRGYSEYLRAFARQSLDGLWLTGFEIEGDGTQMSLRGAARNGRLLPLYIRRLNREPVMRGKTFANLKMQREGEAGVVNFELQSVMTEESKG